MHDGQQLLSFPTDCWSYAFSSDERRFAISNRSGQVYHWLTDAFQNPPFEMIPRDGKVAFEVAFSPNGEELLTGGTDGTIRIHELRLKYELGTWQETSMQGHRRFAVNFNYSPHKDRFCVVQQFESGENLVATIHDREIELQESSEIQEKRFAAIHHDGNLLAIAHKTGSTLWDISDGERIGRASRDYCLRTAFDPDGKRLASFGSGSIKLHDVASRKIVARFQVDRGGFAIDFSPNGDRIVAASWDGTIRIWNTKTMRMETIIEGHTNFPLDVQFTSDERRLLVVSMTQVTLWDIESKRMALLFSRLPQKDWAFGRIADDNSSLTLIESQTGKEFKITMPTEADIQQDLTILDQMGDLAKR